MSILPSITDIKTQAKSTSVLSVLPWKGLGHQKREILVIHGCNMQSYHLMLLNQLVKNIIHALCVCDVPVYTIYQGDTSSLPRLYKINKFVRKTKETYQYVENIFTLNKCSNHGTANKTKKNKHSKTLMFLHILSNFVFGLQKGPPARCCCCLGIPTIDSLTFYIWGDIQDFLSNMSTEPLEWPIIAPAGNGSRLRRHHSGLHSESHPARLFPLFYNLCSHLLHCLPLYTPLCWP